MGELDPLNRRLCSEKKPDVVVQVVILAEDTDIRDKLLQHDIHVQTIAEVAPVEVQPARVLSHLYTYLGNAVLSSKSIYKRIHFQVLVSKLFVSDPFSMELMLKYFK